MNSTFLLHPKASHSFKKDRLPTFFGLKAVLGEELDEELAALEKEFDEDLELSATLAFGTFIEPVPPFIAPVEAKDEPPL